MFAVYTYADATVCCLRTRCHRFISQPSSKMALRSYLPTHILPDTKITRFVCRTTDLFKYRFYTPFIVDEHQALTLSAYGNTVRLMMKVAVSLYILLRENVIKCITLSFIFLQNKYRSIINVRLLFL